MVQPLKTGEPCLQNKCQLGPRTFRAWLPFGSVQGIRRPWKGVGNLRRSQSLRLIETLGQSILDDFGVLYPKSHGLSSCSPFNWSYITIGSILFWAFTQKSLSGTQLEAGRCWYLLGGLKSVRRLRPWLGGMGPQEPIRLASKHSWMFMISPY